MKILVLGAGGFIGGHLTAQLIEEGHAVTCADIKPFRHWHQLHDKAMCFDRFDAGDFDSLRRLGEYHFDEVYNLAADMGGMGFIENHKLDCMLTVLTTVNVLRAAAQFKWSKVVYASSACVYPGFIQNDQANVDALAVELSEEEAYPADPEDGYGWEKLFGERMCRHFMEDTDLRTRVVRFHNIYGPNGTWDGGREKAPAALCRKVAVAKLTESKHVEVWGDGSQLRSFCYVDDAVDGMIQVGRSDYTGPVNVGSSEVVTINRLLELVQDAADYRITPIYVEGALGVKGRSSDNTLIRSLLDWEPSISLAEGIKRTYDWVEEQVRAALATRAVS